MRGDGMGGVLAVELRRIAMGGDVKETYIAFLWSLANDHVLHSHVQELEFELEHRYQLEHKHRHEDAN